MLPSGWVNKRINVREIDFTGEKFAEYSMTRNLRLKKKSRIFLTKKNKKKHFKRNRNFFLQERKTKTNIIKNF